MISEKAGKFINDFAVAVMNNSRTLSAEYIEQEEAAEKALVDYIADLEAENAELRSYRDGYNTNEKLPEEGQKVLVIKNGEYSTYNFSMHLWRSLLAPDFERWWPLPNGGGG